MKQAKKNAPMSTYKTQTVRVQNQNRSASGRAMTRQDAYRAFICTHFI